MRTVRKNLHTSSDVITWWWRKLFQNQKLLLLTEEITHGWVQNLKSKEIQFANYTKKQIRTPTEVNINKYKTEHRLFKAACDKTRVASWRKLQLGIDSIQDMNNFRKIIETGNNISLGTLVTEDGTITDPGDDAVKYLLSKHFPDGQLITLMTYTN